MPFHPIPSSLYSPPVSTPLPPTQTRPQLLPFEKLNWKDFERLCLRLVREEEELEGARCYGEQGDDQEGIDLFARSRIEGKYHVYQCKNVVGFSGAKIRDAVEEFQSGEWLARSSRFVLCTSEALETRNRTDALREQGEALRAQGVELVAWDSTFLSGKLKDFPQIVDDFFGRAWVKVFCGDEAVSTLGSKQQTGISIEQVEAALASYKNRLVREFGTISYRGIANQAIGEPVLELPLNESYVAPDLYTEEQQALLRERDREVHERLQDPDIDQSDKEQLETINALLAQSRWRTEPRDYGLIDGWNTPLAPEATDSASIGELLYRERHCVISGVAGAGKSTMARWIALLCAQNVNELYERLSWEEEKLPGFVPIEMPILMSLPTYARALESRPDLSLKEFVREHIASRGGEPLVAAFELCFERETCWTFFDGLDEVGPTELRVRVIRSLEIWEQECGLNRCIVTSRPYGLASLAGGFTRLHLAPLTPTDIVMVVAAWNFSFAKLQNPEQPDDEKAAAQIRDFIFQIRSNDNIAALAANPLLLVIMVLIHQQQKRLPERRIELYDTIVSTLIDTWNYWRSAEPYNVGGESLPPDQLVRMLSRVALWTRQEKPTGMITRGELQRAMVRALGKRSGEENDAEATARSYLNAVEQAGVLEERVPGVFAFWHPTLEEFLSARELSVVPEQGAAYLLPLRHDPRWREVILLTVGCLGVLQGDKVAATTTVRELANAEPDVTESLLHRHLRLAIECFKNDSGVDRSLAQDLLARLARVVRHQPFEPFGGDFRDAVRTLQRLKPNDDLTLALAELVTVDHTRGAIRAEAMRLLSNVATTNKLARRVCHEILHEPKRLEKDVASYYFSAIGLARAGDFSSEVIEALVWCENPLENADYAVELLGLKAGNLLSGHSKPAIACRQALYSYIGLHPASKSSGKVTLHVRVAAALLLVSAGEEAPEVIAVLEEAILPKSDQEVSGFYAAEMLLSHDFKDKILERDAKLRGFEALQRWLGDSQLQRRLTAALFLLNLIREYSSSAEEPSSERTPQALLDEVPIRLAIRDIASTSDGRLELAVPLSKSIEALIFHLDSSNPMVRIRVALELLEFGQIEPVQRALSRWAAEENEFESFNFLSTEVVARLIRSPEGYQSVVSWLNGEDDWLRMLAIGTLLPQEDHREQVREAMRLCLSSTHEEVRSAVGALLATIELSEIAGISNEVEESLRSCFGSLRGDASSNAAAALYRSGKQDEDVTMHLLPYISSQEIGERFAILEVLKESGEELPMLSLCARKLRLDRRSLRQTFERISQELPLTAQDAQGISKLITRQSGDDHETYLYRRFFMDWVWWRLEGYSDGAN